MAASKCLWFKKALVGTVLQFALPISSANWVFAQVPPVSCQGIAQTTLASPAVDLILDFPMKATKVSEEVFVRVPTYPGRAPTPWVKCQFGNVCEGIHFDVPYSRTDQGDAAETWVEHVWQSCGVQFPYQFCGTRHVRLALTYTLVPTTGQCFSQATFAVGDRQDFELTLFAPAPARGLTWGGLMRELTPGSSWELCDGADFHLCRAKSFNFSQARAIPSDEVDKALGMFFSCTNKWVGSPITTYPGKTRWCRAQIGYIPN